MATTEKGIYYPNDYTKAADVLADMKRTAESVDAAIEKSKYNDKDIKDSIKDIKDEQKIQDKNIEKNTIKNTEQDKLIQKLQSNMIQESTEQDTSIHIEDASDLPAVLSVQGNHYQEQQEGTTNLAVLNEGTVEQNGNKIVVENGIATLSGTNSSDTTNYVKVGTAYLYEGKTYYINNIRNLTSGSHGALLRNKSGATKWFTANTEVVFECTQTGEWEIEISYSSGQFATGTEKFLISETSESEWVQGKKDIPSVEYSAETETVKDNIKIIQCNSNFLKKQAATEITANGIMGKVLDDGSIVLNGTTQYATYIQIDSELKIGRYNDGLNFEKYILPRGNYKFSCQISGQASDTNISAFVRNSVSTSEFSKVLSRLPESSKKEIEFEVKKKEEYVAYMWINSGITLTDFTLKFMLKRSDDNSDYVQNEQKEYNLPVQQEMLKNDKFNLLSNKEMQTWKKTVLTGVENWQQSSVYNDVFYLVINDMMSDVNKAQLISNQYKYEGYITDTGDMQNNKCYTYKQYAVTNNKAVYVKNNNYTTLESFKAALAEKNMTLYYVTSTETELDLTKEQKEVLQQLNALDLYKGTNNIYTEQDLALLQLDYTADTKMYIDNKIANTNAQILNVAGGN